MIASLMQRTLRAETRGDHAILDEMISRLDLSRPSDYGRFLNLHYSALQALETEWRANDVEDFRVMTRCLQNDLRILGLAMPLDRPPARSASTVSNRLGIAYVIRGSRLGAGVLRRRVPLRWAASYLDFVPTLSWPRFIQDLERAAQDSGAFSTDEVVDGARMTFRVFADLLTEALA